MAVAPAQATPVQATDSDAPYIVENGVQMYEVAPGDSGGWPVRVKGDDTYGKGEMIAVSVEFSESMSVDSEATFRIRIGSSVRELARVSVRDETVIFGTIVQSSDNDSDGVWVGDNTDTLDHNDADAIRSMGDSPQSAVLTHPSLGTQSNHKVKGRASRPKVRNVRIISTPQHDDTYIRNETIQIQAKFDRPVSVNGEVGARLTSEALGQPAPRTALYARGSGTSRLVFEYAPLLDIDPDGIAIPANSLAKDGNLAKGAAGGGAIVGKSGGLLANLASSGRGENRRHKIDVRLVLPPEVIAAANWDWAADSTPSSSLTMDFDINRDPGHFSEDHALVLIMGWGYISGTRFAFGLRTDVDKPGTDGSQRKGIVFNRWGTTDTSGHSRTTGDGWTEAADVLGPFISVRRSFDWRKGSYSVRIAQDGDDEQDGRWYGMWLTDKSSGTETKMGALKFPFDSAGRAAIQTRSEVVGSVVALTGDSPINPSSIPVLEAALGLPDDGQGAPPHRATVSYSLLGQEVTNANVTYDAYNYKLVVRVGGSTRRRTPDEAVLTGLGQPAAIALRVPRSHYGEGQRLTFRVWFSEEMPISYKTLRDSAFTVSGGEITKAARVYTSSNMRWEIWVMPDGDGTVSVELPATTDCAATGAICAADGRPLHSGFEIRVPRK